MAAATHVDLQEVQDVWRKLLKVRASIRETTRLWHQSSTLPKDTDLAHICITIERPEFIVPKSTGQLEHCAP